MGIETKESHDRLRSMSEEDRQALDPICEVLNPFLSHLPIRCRANRVVALAVVDLLKQWNEEVMQGP